MAKLNITQEEYEKLRRMGKSKEDIIAQYSGEEPSAITTAAKGVANMFAKGATDTLATNLANIGVAAKGLANVPGALLGNEASKKRFEQAVATSRELPQTSLKQNIGAGVQLGSLIAGGATGAGAPLLARTAAGAGLGAASLGGQAAAQNADTGTIAKQAALGGSLGAGTTLAAAGVEKLGKAVFKYFIPRNKREAQLLQTYKADSSFASRIKAAAMGDGAVPRITADTAFEKGILGTESMMGVQARRAQKNLWEGLIEPQLNSVKEPVKMSDIFGAVSKQISELPENTRRRALTDALKSIADDYLDTPTVSLTRLQDIKSGLAKPVPEKAYLGTYIQGSVNEVRKLISDKMRQKIYDSLGGNIRTAYIDYNNLDNLKKLGQAAMTGQRLKGGSGGLLNALMEKIMVPISTVGGMTIYKVGNAIELIGRPGLNSVGQFILDLTSGSDLQPDSLTTPLRTQQVPSSSRQPSMGK